MTTPKPASAPPADTLPAIVAEMREKAESLLGYSLSAASAEISDWCERIEAIAAQVREAEPLDAVVEAVRRGRHIHEAMREHKPAAEPVPQCLVSSFLCQDYPNCQCARKAEPAPATINSSEIDSKLIGEPVPVAQGIERFDMDPCDYDMVRRPKGKYVLFADHARRESELQYRLDTADAFGEQCMTDIDRLLKEAEALEASLAACRAESWPQGVLARDKTLDILRQHNEWRRGAKGEQTDARMLGLALDAAIAAIDALRQEAP